MEILPSGTVTFLFTDIEGSTRLWEDHAEPMRRSLGRHDALLREIFLRNRGYVFKTVGDAFCVAFDAAPDAAAAALEGQIALRREAWEVPGGIRVRMALHSGIAEERDGDYFGPTLNRAARLLSLGAGGQTILSLVTAELVRDHLPRQSSLLGLGCRRLKDLLRPEDVFQLDHPEIPSQFPPLKSLDDIPNNLPLQPTPFIGRERELEAARSLLAGDGVRLVTLTGIGGAGKTRLALQAAADAIDSFPDGAFFVDLAPLRDPRFFHAAVSRAVGIRDSEKDGAADALKAALRDKRLLLVLDNFEQVMAAAPLVTDLLAGCPRLKAIVTSREAVHARGEHVLPVPPLPVPASGGSLSLAALCQYEAVALFIQRACAVHPDFRVTNGNAPAVAQICSRLDGLPLAIELAAARIAVLSPEGLLKRLDDRLRILTGGFTDLPARQRTLRAAIDWSYDLLSAGEQALFRRLAVFEDSFCMEAAESVCAAKACPDVLEGLSSLAAKSMLGREETERETWFRMLAVVRDYAREKLDADPEREEVRGAHARFHRAMAAEAEAGMRGTERTLWMDRLERSHADLRASLEFLLDHRQGDEALPMCTSLAAFWGIRGYPQEGRLLTEMALAQAASSPADLRWPALLAAGNLAQSQWDHRTAIRFFQEALRLLEPTDRGNRARILAALGWSQFRSLEREAAKASFSALREEHLSDDPDLLANADNGLALLAMDEGRFSEAGDLLERSLEAFQASGSGRRIAQTLGNLGIVRLRMGDLREALRLAEESLALLRRIGDVVGQQNLLNNIGDLRMRTGDFPAAGESFAQLLELARRTANLRMQSFAHAGLADSRLGRGMTEAALESAREAERIARATGDGPELGVALRALGEARLLSGSVKEAMACFAESLPILMKTGCLEDAAKVRQGLRLAQDT